MIFVDEREPEGEPPPPFPPRAVTLKDDEDIHSFYHLKKEIGRGRFGTVYVAEEKATGQRLAAKFVSTKRRQDRDNACREIDIMKSLNAEQPHPLLIQLYDAYDMIKEMCLVLEIVDGGELFERVIDESFVLTERACTVFIRQICQGVEYIHSKNILHLDMKPENILCLSREGNRVKICDFGLARRYDPRKKLQVLFGTPEFVAPEVVNFEPISFGTDLWSVGVICYVLLSGLSPFMGHDYVETMTNVSHNKYDFDDSAFDKVSDEAKDFIEKLLVLDKSLRLTPTQCLQHNWLRRPPPSTLCRRCSGSEYESESGSEVEEDLDLHELSQEKIVQEEQKNEKDNMAEDELKQSKVERKEVEKQIEDIKKEVKHITEARKREEELEQTKLQLREFVERWNSHPNSPYLIGTPIPLDLQHLVSTGGWNSRASLTSVAVAPPSDHSEASLLDEDGHIFNDLSKVTNQKAVIHDIDGQEDFKVYTLEPAEPLTKKPSPEEVAKQLEFKLTQLQLEDTLRLSKDDSTAEGNHTVTHAPKARGNEENKWSNKTVKLTDKSKQVDKMTIKRNEITNTSKDVYENNNEHKRDKELLSTKKKEHKVTEIQNKRNETERKVIEIPKKMSEENMDKHKKAYEERKKIKNLGADQIKDEDQKVTSSCHQNQELREKQKAEERKPAKLPGSIVYEEPKEAEMIISEILKGDHKAAYEEYKRMVSEAQKTNTDEQNTKDNLKEKKANWSPYNPQGADIRQEPNNIVNKTTGKQGDTNKREQEYKRTVSSVQSNRKQKKEDEKRVTGRVEDLKKENVTGKQNIVSKRTTGQENMNHVEKKGEDQRFQMQETEMAEHRRAYEEYKRMVDLTQIKMSKDKNDLKISKTMEEHKTVSQEEITEMGSIVPKRNTDLNKKSNDSLKKPEIRKISSISKCDHLPMEPLKRPEIIALQNEELGGVILRSRKKSSSQAEQEGEGLAKDQTPRPTISRQSEDLESCPSDSRSSTPTKQLKKQPSRDVPLQAKNLEREDRGVTPFRQWALRDVDSDGFHGSGKQSPQDITPESSSCLNRNPSHEERPPSRESDRGTRGGTPFSSGHRRPSRDVPLSTVQMDRLTAASGLVCPDLMLSQTQAWPDLIVAPQGENADLQDYKNSLDVPVATLVKSPSGKQLSVPELTVSQDRQNPYPPLSSSNNLEARDDKATRESAYVSNNKLVAWILDIGNTQNKCTSSLSTVDLVNQWESRDSSPRLSPSPSRDRSPKPRDKPQMPVRRDRDKSPVARRLQPPFKALSREPSSDNLHIQTPWGTLKRSPSKSNLSKSPSFEAPTTLGRKMETNGQRKTETLMQNLDNDVCNGSCAQFTSLRTLESQLEREDPLTTDSQLHLWGSDEIPHEHIQKIKKAQKCEKEDTDYKNKAKQEDVRSHTLPRPSKLMKIRSTDSLNLNLNEGKRDIKRPLSVKTTKANDKDNSQNLKRKSKFPPSSNQKKIGLLLFSAQDRISQFEQQQPTTRPPQRPITRSRSNVVLSSYSERLSSSDHTSEKKLVSEITVNSLNEASASSRVGKNSQVGFLRTRLLDKVGSRMAATLSEESHNNKSSSSSTASERQSGSGNSRPTSSHKHNPYAAAHSTRHP